MEHTLSLGKYLSCLVITEHVTKETFGDLVDKTQKQLGKWKSNSLSQMGRAVLIQSNLATKANYQMQSFLLPTTNITKIDKINRNFL